MTPERLLTAVSRHRTIARSFSAELGDIFRIENSLTDLDREVDSRYVSVARIKHRIASNSLTRPSLSTGRRRSTARHRSSPHSRRASARWSSASSSLRPRALPSPPTPTSLPNNSRSRRKPPARTAHDQAPPARPSRHLPLATCPPRPVAARVSDQYLAPVTILLPVVATVSAADTRCFVLASRW